MPPQIAAIIFAAGILVLFLLDRDRETQTSIALWIPVFWLLINGSRPLSMWLSAAGLTSAETVMDTPEQYLEGSPTDRAFYLLLVVAGLLVLGFGRRRVGPLLRRNLPLLLFFLYCALSILWSDYSFVAFKRWIKGTGDIVMVLVVLTDLQPEAAIKRFISRTSFLLIPLSVLFIKYYPNLGLQYNKWSWTQEYIGVGTTKNMLGMTCLVCGIGSVWRFLSVLLDKENSSRFRQLFAHGTIIALTLWLFSMAHSTTSLVCFTLGTGMLTMTTFFSWGRKPAVLHLYVATAVCMSAFALFLDSGGSLVESLGKDPTLTGRTDIWRLVISLVANPFVGAGYESFWLGSRLQHVWDVYEGIQEAHNGYLEVFLNLGSVGIALLVALIVTGYRKAMAAYRRNFNLGRLCLVYVIIGILYSFAEAGFRSMSVVWICFLMAIIAASRITLPEGLDSLQSLPGDPS